MRRLVQFARDLALLPTMWRSAVKSARWEALLDQYIAEVGRKHPDWPQHKQRNMAASLRFSHGYAETLAVVRLRHLHLPDDEQVNIARNLHAEYDDPVAQAQRGAVA